MFPGKTSWTTLRTDSCAQVRVVLDVTDVLVSPSSVVTELCYVSPCCSDWDFLEPQSFSFSIKRAHSNTRSVAAGIASQRKLGASEMLPRHRLQRINDEERLHRFKKWTWEEYKETFKEKMRASGCAFDRTQEAFDLVAVDEAEKMSIVQEIMLKVRATCGESLRPSEDRVVSQCLTSARTATVSLWNTTFGGSLGERPEAGGAQFVERSTTGGNPTGFW